MSGAKNVAKVFFGRYLVVTNTLASGCLMGAGDVAAQCLEKKNFSTASWDKLRTGRFFTLGICIGPMNHVWYSFLDRLLPVVTKRTVVKKIFLDQSIAGPLNIAAFFIGLGCLEQKPIKQGASDFRNNFWNVFKMDLTIWPAAQLINFYWMPREVRMLYVCCVSFAWNTYLAFYRNKYVSSPQGDKPHTTGQTAKAKSCLVTKNGKVELSEEQKKTILDRAKKIAEHIKL